MNKKRVCRHYCLDNLNLRLNFKRKAPARPRLQAVSESQTNRPASIAFVKNASSSTGFFRWKMPS